MIENILLIILIPISLAITYTLAMLIVELYRPTVKYLKDGEIAGYKI